MSDSNLLAGFSPSFTLRVKTRTIVSRIVRLDNKPLGGPASATHWRRRFPGLARPRTVARELGGNRDRHRLQLLEQLYVERSALLHETVGHASIPSRPFTVRSDSVEWDRLSHAISLLSERIPAVVGLLDAINRSRTILTLADDWDGEGAAGYSELTWQRATLFLMRQAELAAEQFHISLEVPRISPADQGSIDLFWRSQDRRLLINFPADDIAPATYYGENSRGDTISGHINTDSSRPDLVAWLATAA